MSAKTVLLAMSIFLTLGPHGLAEELSSGDIKAKHGAIHCELAGVDQTHLNLSQKKRNLANRKTIQGDSLGISARTTQ